MNQFQWESEAYSEGMDKFFDSEIQAQREGKMNETAVGDSVLKQRVLGAGDRLAAEATKSTAGRGGAYIQALQIAATRYNGREFIQDYNIPAYVGLLTMLQACYARNKSAAYLTPMALEIGRRLEFDQKLYVFRQDNPAFVGKIETSLVQQGVTSVNHKLKVFQKKWKDNEMVWTDWGDVKRAQVGIKVIRSILTEMDDCFELTKKHDGKHPRFFIDTTLEFDDYVTSETDLISKTMPLMQPMIEPPLEWVRSEGEVIGGFHTPELRRAAPFIKTKGKEHREYVDSAYPHKHMTAVNHMQKTEWAINQPIVDAVTEYIKLGITFDVLPRQEKLEIPAHPGDDAAPDEHQAWLIDAKRIHGKNKQNSSALIILGQSLKMAARLQERSFWFAYTCDFRGRIYCTSTTLSPQGTDHIKAMIRFKTGKPLGEEGIRWTAINGANKYGNDKISLDARVRWIASQQDSISRICSEPTGSFARSFLAGADKPFQFLAFCFEWRACGYGRDADAHGYLPVGLDGSCNGLQHYAALLRDRRGGAGVNLLPASVPEDIYRDVANEFLRLVPHDDMGKKFHAIGADRKLTKRPVMTLPYGSTQQSCRDYIREYVGDNHEKFGFTDEGKQHWEAATYATPYMWQAIGNVVVAARTGMDWLQECAGIIGKKGIYSRWLSPADFPVYQHYCEHDNIRVTTDLFGRVQLNLEGAQTDLNVRRARNGIAPNFVHALDSSHMVMTILEAATRGHTDMAMIHDDFGVHACDTEEFYNLIRLTFVRMYYEHDWLQVWKKEQERLLELLQLPDPPERGDLDILEVLDSPFFFS